MPLFESIKGKYSLKDKEELLNVIKKDKLLYDEESGWTYYDTKQKKHVLKNPKEGYISKSILEYYLDLKDVSSNDLNFQKTFFVILGVDVYSMVDAY